MVRQTLAATGIAVTMVSCVGGAAAVEFNTHYSVGDGFADDWSTAEAAIEHGFASEGGYWRFGPVAGLSLSRGDPHGYTPTGIAGLPPTAWQARRGPLVGSLGFRGAAKVDSRLGPIFSRLSLTFEHEFLAKDHLIVTGLTGAGKNGYYGDDSGVDVMKLDAAFAMNMSNSVTGYLDYGAQMDLDSDTDHDVALRLKFAF